MVRRLGSILTVACLFLAGFAPVAAVAVPAGTAAAPTTVRARPSLEVKVDWPTAPVAGKLVTVHVRRPGVGPTTTRLERQYGSGWETMVHKSVSARSFVFRVKADVNRYKLRVVLPHAISRTYAAPQPAPLVRRVGYADGPVRTTVPGRQIALLFAGKRDQVVEVATDSEGPHGCRTTRLRGPAGWIIAPQRSGLWRLPRTATYRAEAVPCWGFSIVNADLTRVRLLPLDLNAAPVTLRARNGVADVAVVTVPRTGRVMVRGWEGADPRHRWDSIIYPTGLQLFTYGSVVPDLEAGKSLSDGFNSGVITPGRYLLRPAKDDLKASVSTALTTSITPEGPAVTLGDGGVTGREREFTFTGTAGTFVYPETARPGWSTGAYSGLYGPDGGRVGDWHYGEGWLLRNDGTYTLRVTPGDADADAGTPVTVRLRQAVTLPPMQYGAPTRFTLDGSDRWLVTTVEVPNQPDYPRFAVSGSTMTGPWEAIAGAATTNYCAAGPGPNGCSDNYFTTVNQDTPTASHHPWGLNPALVVLRPGAGVTGSVDLTLGP
jgi:hypothetical protein